MNETDQEIENSQLSSVQDHSLESRAHLQREENLYVETILKGSLTYDGNDFDPYDLEVDQNYYAGLQPEPKISVSDWVQQYRVVAGKGAADSGAWKNEKTPYLVEIMNCLNDPKIVEVVFMEGGPIRGNRGGAQLDRGDHAPVDH